MGYIENLRRATAEKERIGAELNIATRIQASMLSAENLPVSMRDTILPGSNGGTVLTGSG
jgi:hypothetical protein